RLTGAREQRPARELVALPLADLGRGDVTDVVDVENEQRTKLGGFQRLAHAAQPVAVQPAVVDALLEVDTHGAERRQRAAPVETGIDILGADLADPVIHDASPDGNQRARWAQLARLYSVTVLYACPAHLSRGGRSVRVAALL